MCAAPHGIWITSFDTYGHTSIHAGRRSADRVCRWWWCEMCVWQISIVSAAIRSVLGMIESNASVLWMDEFHFIFSQILCSAFAHFGCKRTHNDDDYSFFSRSFPFCWSNQAKLKYIQNEKWRKNWNECDLLHLATHMNPHLRISPRTNNERKNECVFATLFPLSLALLLLWSLNSKRCVFLFFFCVTVTSWSYIFSGCVFAVYEMKIVRTRACSPNDKCTEQINKKKKMVKEETERKNTLTHKRQAATTRTNK